MIKTTLLAAALAATATLATLSGAAADDRRCGNVPVERWMSEQQIRDRAGQLGLDVRDIDIDDGCYEVEARNRDGRGVEVRFNPETGEQVSIDGDD